MTALTGHSLLSQFSTALTAATTAIAAEAILAMISDTMILESLATAHDFADLLTVCGCFNAFVLSKLGG